MTLARGLVASLVLPATLGAVAVGGAPVAVAATYASRTLAEPAASGLPVAPPLNDLRAGSAVRVLLPTSWRRQAGAGGGLRLLVDQNASCHFTLTFRVDSVIAAAQDPGERVTAALPAAGPQYVLDGGERGNAAFRIIRRPSGDGRIRLDARWTGLLTRRDDIAGAGGAVAWTDLTVTVTSRPGDECHAGTYRSALGPALGDVLAAARTSLRFARP